MEKPQILGYFSDRQLLIYSEEKYSENRIRSGYECVQVNPVALKIVLFLLRTHRINRPVLRSVLMKLDERERISLLITKDHPPSALQVCRCSLQVDI